MNYNQQFQQQRVQNYPTQAWPSRIRPVSSIEEVRASSIDFDGSIFYFPDFANKKIYTKQINLDGTATILMYELKELPTLDNYSQIDTSMFITREEFEKAMSQFSSMLKTKEDVAATPVTKQQSFSF